MPEDYKVYLGNVPEDARERDVEKFFKGYGHIYNIILKVDFCLESIDKQYWQIRSVPVKLRKNLKIFYGKSKS
jgi:RNA recognition motif-containing protein